MMELSIQTEIRRERVLVLEAKNEKEKQLFELLNKDGISVLKIRYYLPDKIALQLPVSVASRWQP